MWSANISLQTMVVWSGWHQQISQHGVRMTQWPLAAKALATAFNLDFVHYRSQISSLSPRFSDEGFAGYVNALQASNILETIKKEKMNLTATTGAGVLVRQGQMSDGVWFWTFQYPVRMRLVGQTTSKPEQSFVFEITIQRVDPRLKPSGMEIRQMISRNAGPNS
ncbi:DotI/IcmL family type IV secretion protein [Escherichia coli]|nr:DotI/IcmL family type IV secretion protein [Escherichia coli]